MAGSFEAFLPFDHLLLEMNYSVYSYSALIKLLIKKIKLSKFLLLKGLHAYNLFGTAYLHKFTNRICTYLDL